MSCASELGLKSFKITVSEDALRDALSAGNVVIANVGPGDFTEGGHYIVLTGLDSEGRVVVNDPCSVKNSERTWSVAEIMEFVVDPLRRSKGVGAGMFEEACRIAREHGCSQIEVACNQLRTDTRRFYLRQGMKSYHFKFSLLLDGEDSGENALGR